MNICSQIIQAIDFPNSRELLTFFVNHQWSSEYGVGLSCKELWVRLPAMAGLGGHTKFEISPLVRICFKFLKSQGTSQLIMCIVQVFYMITLICSLSCSKKWYKWPFQFFPVYFYCTLRNVILTEWGETINTSNTSCLWNVYLF